jgi:hypothetical protein
MTDAKKPARGTRPRAQRIEVWLTPEEREEIAGRAAQSGMSLSAYLRTAGLNHPIRSVYDLKAVAELGKVNGDLGRVAGLLKLWLAEKRGQGARPLDVEAMMNAFRALQRELSNIMGRVRE